MSTGIWSAASGAVGQIAALDSAAQNIANATTPGFKAEEAVFRQTLVKSIDANTGTRSLRYAVSRTTVPDFRAGQMVQTGRPLDVAITDDKSFFMVATPQGERYTRAGSFRMTLNGTLTTPDGHPVLGANRRPIKIDPHSRNISLDREGTLTSISIDNQGTLTPLVGPKLKLVTFKNLGALERDGQVLFRALPGAGPPLASDALLETASLEQSNANAVTGMTTLVNSSRNFEMISKVIEAFGEIDKRAASGIMGK
jgi:flagellar basal body rod protein FlgG